MKVLHVSLWPIDKNSIGGTEKYVINLSSELARSIDNEVLMLSGRSTVINKVKYIALNIDSSEKLDEYSIKNNYFSEFNRGSLLEFSDRINNCFDFSKYDVVHFNSLLFYYCASSLKRVFTIHTNPEEFDQNWGVSSFSKISKLIKNDLASDTLFIAPSKYYSELYEQRFEKKVTTIAHCLLEKHLILERKSLKKNKDLVIFVPSRLEIQQKGQDLLLESINSIKKDLPKFRVIFSGLDRQYQDNKVYLKKLAEKFDITAEFKNLDNIEMSKVYVDADLVVIPSRYESFGYSVLEALFLDKKTVLSDIPTFKEIAQGSNCSYIADVSDPTAFGKTILKAIRSKQKRQSKKWLASYSLDEWAKSYIRYYELCLKN